MKLRSVPLLNCDRCGLLLRIRINKNNWRVELVGSLLDSLLSIHSNIRDKLTTL